MLNRKKMLLFSVLAPSTDWLRYRLLRRDCWLRSIWNIAPLPFIICNYDISIDPLFLPSILLKPGAIILSMGKVVSVKGLWVIIYLAPDEMQLNIVVPYALERQEMGFGKKWPQTSPNTGGVYFCKEPFSADVTPRPFFSLGLMWHPGLPCCKIPDLTATSFSSKCPMSDVKDLHISKLGNRRCFWDDTRSVFQSAVWKFVQVFIRVPQAHHYLRSHYHDMAHRNAILLWSLDVEIYYILWKHEYIEGLYRG